MITLKFRYTRFVKGYGSSNKNTQMNMRIKKYNQTDQKLIKTDEKLIMNSCSENKKESSENKYIRTGIQPLIYPPDHLPDRSPIWIIALCIFAVSKVHGLHTCASPLMRIAPAARDAGASPG